MEKSERNTQEPMQKAGLKLSQELVKKIMAELHFIRQNRGFLDTAAKEHLAARVVEAAVDGLEAQVGLLIVQQAGEVDQVIFYRQNHLNQLIIAIIHQSTGS